MSFFNIIYTFLWSIFEPCYIQNGWYNKRCYKDVVVYVDIFLTLYLAMKTYMYAVGTH